MRHGFVRRNFIGHHRWNGRESTNQHLEYKQRFFLADQSKNYADCASKMAIYRRKASSGFRSAKFEMRSL